MVRNSYTHGNVSILLFFLILFLLIGGGALWLANYRDLHFPRTPHEEDAETFPGWQTYRNDEFGFALEYPDSWTVAALADNPIAPTFNVYPPVSLGKPPFTHHHNVTQVSVFPHGVPTEGVFGRTASGDDTFVPEAGEVRNFILGDGTTWATMASRFSGAPSRWNEAGFIWASIAVENLTTECRWNGEVLSAGQCDPFLGDSVIQHGSVDEAERDIVERVLASFRFLESSGGTEARGVSQLIRVTTPKPNQLITSPLRVAGEARGTWYFEASFPLVLTDWDGRIIAEGFAQAQSDPATGEVNWMTEEFVPFEGTLTFTKPVYGKRGTLILKKDNPSGLPEHDAALEIPIHFQ